jgi:hypothetical protein
MNPINLLIVITFLIGIVVIILHLLKQYNIHIVTSARTTVTLFSQCNYTGTSVPVTLGFHKIAEFGELAPIMSIQVPPGLSVTLMKNGGSVLIFTTSEPCVYYTRFMITSINVETL